MTAVRISGLCALALLVSQAVFAPATHAASAGAALSQEELTKQRRIYQSRGSETPSGYVIDRALALYADALAADFDRSLAALGPAERWLDIGAGEGNAVLEYCTTRAEAPNAKLEASGERARVVAISIEDRRTPRWHETASALGAGQIEYLYGKTLREYSAQELGHFKLITDVMGGFSYSTEISSFMEKALSLLEVDGSFFTVLADVHSESGGNRPHYPDSAYLTEIRAADGAEVKVCAWLKRISCVQVTCGFKSDWTPPIEAYQIRKTCDDVRVPALVPLRYQAGTPPERAFRLRDPASPPSDAPVAETASR
ncbi:MAG: hypothetical protein EHM59_19980 [Betaproteobacteria bacterium]|nr:MAG: hypothetical protein EHM59_19980 [Betaproteobacteria bacterium]